MVQDLAGEFAERKGGGSRRDYGPFDLQPGAPQPHAPAPGILRPTPGRP